MAPSSELVHPDVLTLAELMRADWPAVRERIRLSGHPTNLAAEADGDEDADAGEDKDADDEKGDADDPDADKGEADEDEPDWKRMSRKHERAEKASRKREADLTKRLAEREDADKTEQQKAIDAAREEARAEVTSKYEAEQRTDRIENAVTKLSLRGFKVKDKSGKPVTVKFADPDDAQLRIDRALRTNDLDVEDIYTDGKVQTPALAAFLAELLEEHPRLRAGADEGSTTEPVDMDGGRGTGGGAARDLESMSPDDHLKDIQRR